MKIEKVKAWMAASAIVLGVGGLTAGAEAAPIGLQVTDGGAGCIDKVAQRCWGYHGTRHCRWYGYQPRYCRYGYPANYRTGSRCRWEEMDREDRSGRSTLTDAATPEALARYADAGDVMLASRVLHSLALVGGGRSLSSPPAPEPTILVRLWHRSVAALPWPELRRAWPSATSPCPGAFC